MHLIMFSDSSQTINVELKRWHIAMLVATLIVILASFFLSVVFVVRSYFFYQDTVAKAKQYKNAIAQYQIKYEGLYESAYKKSPVNTMPSRYKRNPGLVSERKVTPTSAKAPAKSGVPKKAMALAAKAPIANELSVPVSYSMVNLKRGMKELQIKVKISNKLKESKRSGNIAAVAAFRLENGDLIYQAWPSHVRIHSEKGHVLDMNDGPKYHIRSFKFEKLTFAKPLTAKGKFEKVRLFIQEKDQAQHVFEIDVDSKR